MEGEALADPATSYLRDLIEYMTADACTSRTSRVLILASMQQLMEALFPTPTNGEVRSMTKFLNAQSIVPIEIHCV